MATFWTAKGWLASRISIIIRIFNMIDVLVKFLFDEEFLDELWFIKKIIVNMKMIKFWI